MADEVNGPYRVVVTRERDAWLADVPEVDGAHTWARDLKKLDNFVREAIALSLDLPEGAESELLLAYDFRTGDATIDDAAASLRTARDEYERLGRELGERTRALATELARTGWSVRDIAGLVGVSFQRVGQILTGGRGGPPVRAGTTGKFVRNSPAVGGATVRSGMGAKATPATRRRSKAEA